MSTTSRNRRRDLVIDGRTWRWLVTTYSVFVWEPAPSTRRHSFQRAVCDDPDWGGPYPIGPGDVVAWIRENLLPGSVAQPRRIAAPPPRPAVKPRRLVPVMGPQQQAYLVLAVTEDVTGDCALSELVSEVQPLEVHLDPQLAIERATALNGDAPQRVRLARELRQAVSRVEQDAAYARYGRRARTLEDCERARQRTVDSFFARQGIDDPERREWVSSCPDYVRTYSVTAKPLFASALV